LVAAARAETGSLRQAHSDRCGRSTFGSVFVEPFAVLQRADLKADATVLTLKKVL